MRTLLPRFLLACLAVFGLASCAFDSGYYGSSYSSGYYYDDYDDDYYYPGHYTGYRRPYYSYGSSSYHRHHAVCQRCHRNPCCCARTRIVHRDHDHDAHDHRRSSSPDNRLKLVGERGGPKGYHSADWYRDRGYTMKKNTFVNRDGERVGRAPSHSHDNGHKGSKGKKH